MRSTGLLMMLPAVLAHAAETTGIDELHTVVVTGSRIRASQADSTGPVVVVSREQLTRGGNDSLGKVLQTLPFNTGAPANTNVNGGGDGSVRIDLRGLEPQRTLVLLNGRRLPNGGIGADSSVDIDSLPLSMVERVEVLTTGASAVYGADAIGGVVNVITRSDLTGVELGAQRSGTEHGDGAITRVQALVGDDTGRSSWMLGADYVEQNGVSASAREHSAIPLGIANVDGLLVPLGSDAVPDGVFSVPGGNALGLQPGDYTRVAGSTGQAASDWRPFTPGDTFNFAPYTYLQTPNERWSLWTMGRLRLSDAAELFVEGSWRRRDSSQNRAPAPYFVIQGAAPMQEDGTPMIPANNHYNPFGVDVLNGARRLIELGDRHFAQRVEMWRALAGVRGTLGSWRWEAAVAASESDAVTHESGLPLAQRFVAGLGPSGPDSAGRIVCGTPDALTGVVPASAVVAGCVPINLFGGAGSIPQEQVDYLGGPLSDRGSYSQRLANIGFDGAWGRTSAGEVLWALGGEFRRDSGAYQFDPQRVGGTVSTGLAPYVPGGSFDALEGYAEVRVPVLGGRSSWGKLDVTLGGRLSDFSTFGTQATWRGGLRWSPARQWALRIDYAQAFRAPALNELYRVQSIGASDFRDPCGDSPTPQQQVNCAANGVPGGAYVQPGGDSHFVREGGNAELEPEAGYSLDAGIEFHSTGAVAARTSIDFFQTRLDGFVAAGEEGAILDECASHGRSIACSKIERFADGSLRSVDLRNSNLGRVVVRGIDLAASLDFATRAGALSVQALVTRLLEYETQAFEGGASLERLGTSNVGSVLPEWRASSALSWQQSAWRAAYTLQWIGPYAFNAFTQQGEPFTGDVPSVLYHDVEASYRWRGIALRAGVTNLTDRDPPFLGGEVNTNAATYRLLGRTYFLQLTYATQ
ncbi:MAG TPA: TonB-dependent receptor [Steroidobacteraceae bacterium]|nr:TonB-dependent receptor [Steroidobacteraceae bacterium]